MDGETGLAAIGDTPLLALPSVRPDGGARVVAKWEGANPSGSMKDRMARAMIRGAEADGTLDPGQHVVEYTGGSTGSALAMVCGVLDYPLTLLTADCFAAEKIRTMEALGAELEILETPEGKVYPGLFDRMEARITELADELDAHYTDQFDNPHHLEGYHPLGREIARECPDVTDFVMGVGTGGGAMGSAAGIRETVPDVTVTVVEPAESPYLTEREAGSHQVEGLALGVDPPYLESEGYDDAVAIPEEDGFATCRRLAREEGVFAGASTGLNVAAAVEVARERDPDDVVATVAVDTGLKYLHGDLYR